MAHPDTTASFSYWVRRQRMSLDLTQAGLARQVGCATVTISKIERDERRPSRQMAGLLADILAIADEERGRFLAAALGEQATDGMALATQPLAAPFHGQEERRRSNLPVAPTPFVGREDELERLTHRLQEPACRLLTLVAPGGFGKTRLAIRLGEILLTQEQAFPDGVFFVPLEGLEGREEVLAVIAATLHFTFHEQQDQNSQLLRYLAGKQLMLILDNAEQRLPGELVEELLMQAPGIKVVVTSREALNLQQEWFHPIDGLDVEMSGMEKDEIADAVRLFQQSALRARPDFSLKSELVNVQQICRLVDGAPLAIELAAAWLKALPCGQIAKELERSLDFLSTSLCDIPARHRSLRVVLEQTWQHLTAEEQRVFRHLSVFVGGFRSDAAEQVAETSLQTLASLVEKSVLQLMHGGRYRIHAMLRQLAAEKLVGQPQELASAQDRQCDVYMATLRDRRRSISGPKQKAELAEMQADLENIRAAWTYAARHNRLVDLSEGLPALFRFLWTQGRYEEGERLTALALDELNTATMTDEGWPVQIALSTRWSQFAAARGAHQQALAMLDGALGTAKRVECPAGQALCFYVIGTIADHLLDADRAIENLNAARTLYRELHDDAGLAETASVLGYSYLYLAGDYETGQQLVEESLRFFREIGDLSSTADTLDRIASTYWKLGAIDEAEACYRESLALARDVGHQLVIAKCVGGLGMVAWARSQWESAIQLLQERLERMQELGHETEVYASLNLLCGIYLHAGRHAEAVILLDTHPGMRRTYWTAQAQVRTGRYAEAMRYLPQETAAMLAAGNSYDLASYLIAWAILLASDCVLVTDAGLAGETISLTHEMRTRKSTAILCLLCSYDQCRADTRKRAEFLLAELHNAAGKWHGDRSIDDLAEEMLAIRLG